MSTKPLAFVRAKTETVIFAFAFSLALALAAHAKIPLFFTPVPLTLQTFIVYLAIRILKKGAVFSILLYLAAGIAGFPVFAGNSLGISYLAGPTGGYILGFLVACLICPFLFSNSKNLSKNILCFLTAAFIIYSLGLIWLVSLFKLNLQTALIAGFYPFLAGEVIKIAGAAYLTKFTH